MNLDSDDRISKEVFSTTHIRREEDASIIKRLRTFSTSDRKIGDEKSTDTIS
jgi:hypothetical protein